MKKTVIMIGLLALILQVQAKSYQAPTGGKPISHDLWGIFLEDINYAADGGLYAEMVQNRSFEYTLSEHDGWGPFTSWKFLQAGHSVGDITIKTDSPLHPNNTHYATLYSEVVGLYRGDSEFQGVGLQNSGYDGMPLTAGETYHFSIWARGQIRMQVALLTGDNHVISSDTIAVDGTGWKQYEATLQSDTTLTDGKLIVLAIEPGTVDLDMVSLFPQHTYKERPNGMRADLVEILRQLKPRFMRFPGGCLVHGPGLKYLYNWKNTIGPVWQRKSQPDCWQYHQSLGIGYYEYFQLCEDLGCKPLPVVHAGVTCQGDAKGWNIPGTGQRSLSEEEMKDYVQDVLDMIEWATGPADSRWGKVRAEAGHPEPFHLEYIGIGNEENVTDNLVRNETMLYRAIHERYPEITVIGTSGFTANGKSHDRGFALAKELGIKVVDEHYFQSPEWLIEHQNRYDSYDRKGPQVYFGEYGSKDCRLRNALVEAVYMTGLERNGDVVRMASYAPLFGRKDYCQWNPDLIYFDKTSVCPTPNYYVQKLFSNNAGDYYYGDIISVEGDEPLLGRSCVFDSSTGDVILKLSNADATDKQIIVDLSRFKQLGKKAEITTLTGSPDSKNDFGNICLVPVVREKALGKKFQLTVPANTFQVIRFKHHRQGHRMPPIQGKEKSQGRGALENESIKQQSFLYIVTTNLKPHL